MTHHVPMFSGGLGSWITSRRAVDLAAPGDRVTMLFADVKGTSSSPHVGEDEDTYRFIAEASADVTAELVTVMVYVGIDWSETHRLPAIEAGWAPYPVVAPLTEAPYLDRDDMLAECEAAGIEVPRLYRAGFAHNNCGGFCVRAGQAQQERLLREHPDRYRFHEEKEAELREYLGKDVAVLRDRRGGTLKPLTLTAFRERLEEDAGLFDALDVGGCGCFTQDEGVEK